MFVNRLRLPEIIPGSLIICRLIQFLYILFVYAENVHTLLRAVKPLRTTALAYGLQRPFSLIS